MMGTHHLRLACLPVAALAMLTLLAAPAIAQTKIRFALDGPLNGVHAPFALAQDRGFYKAEGLEVALDLSLAQTAPASSAPADALSRLANGAADMALADINALVRLRE